MTWPGGIAAALGLIAALLILIHQHRSNTQTQHARRTENRHDHQDTQGHHQHGPRAGQQGHG